MTYFVLLPDGRRFGPADLTLLQAWVLEGRLHPYYLLEDAATGARIEARHLPGLRFMDQAPSYPSFQNPEDGASDVRAAYVCAVLGFLCCPPVSLAGIVFAVRARDRGHSGGNLALGVSVASFILALGLNMFLYRGMSWLR